MNDETEIQAPEFEPDEFTGIGGEYVRDPKTGKRSPKPPESDPQESIIEE